MIWRQRQRPFDTLKVLVTKVEGGREYIKVLVDIMRERAALCGRRGDLSKGGGRKHGQYRRIEISSGGGRD